jgi:hydrogenase expression/formation protein HypC
MCLGIPGKVVEVEGSDLGLVQGKVDFGGIVKDVNLSFTPEVEVGQYVVVHVGFSISTLDEDEAVRALEHLRELGELDAQLRGDGNGTDAGGPP